jgi:hypothetical protein
MVISYAVSNIVSSFIAVADAVFVPVRPAGRREPGPRPHPLPALNRYAYREQMNAFNDWWLKA